MELPEMLLIGGATRNVGKTSLTVKVIKAFAHETVVALKIKTIYPNDTFFHGQKDKVVLETDYRIIEEINANGTDDTNLMLNAGATRVFRISCKVHAIGEAFDSLIDNYLGTKPYCFICESNSLRKVLTPGVYIMIKHANNSDMKPSATEMEKHADVIIYTDGNSHNFNVDHLSFKNNTWRLKK